MHTSDGCPNAEVLVEDTRRNTPTLVMGAEVLRCQ